MYNNIIKYLDRDEFLIPFDKFYDKLMNQNFPDFGKAVGIDFFHNGSYPKVDALEYDDMVVIQAEIPGISKDDLSIKVENNVLTISGGKRDTEESKKAKYIIRELKRSSFKRSFTLHESLEVNSIKATFENGLLFVTINKKIKNEIKEVEIKIG